MSPLFADAIDIPMVLFGGIVVLVPLMAFEIFIEALVLKKIWELPYRELCKLTFFANCWSLLAGIPTKILNAYLYAVILPQDIPGFFARYPFAAAMGSLIYFAVTVLVEGAYAFRWLRRRQMTLSRKQIWRGMLLANVATYAVLAPLTYFATRPPNDIREFSNDTRWTSHAGTRVLFVGADDGYLKSVQADGSGLKTIVPVPMADYLVSSNLDVCLFRGTNGNLYLYRPGSGKTTLIWTTNERFYMDQAAFSPSGEHVAFATEQGGSVEWMNVKTGERMHVPLAVASGSGESSVAWSLEEEKFYVAHSGSRLEVTIGSKGDPVVSPLFGTNAFPVLKCYGQAGGDRWGGGRKWGVSRNTDSCGDLKAWSERGLASVLTIYHEGEKADTQVLRVSVNPGLLHLGGFDFGDVEFLDGCGECLFDANGYIYVLDVNEKHLGTLAKGDRFIQLTPRFEKGF